MEEGRNITRFGVFEADLEAGELRRNGVKVRLQEQPFQVLAALLEKPGDIVTKEELQRRIWNGDTFVDFDRSLATAVNKVRHALGDSATRPRFVETVPKKGYRFIGIGAPAQTIGPPASRSVLRLALAVVVAVALAVGGIVIANVVNGVSEPEMLGAVPLTTDPSYELWPSFSPDGEYLSFAAGDALRGDFDIYRLHLDSRERIAVTGDPRPDYSPAWSPDGRSIGFLRDHGEGVFGVYVTSPFGGRERLLAEVAATTVILFAEYHPALAWTHDSAYLATGDRVPGEAGFRLVRIDVETGRKSVIQGLPGNPDGSFEARFSPDGKGVVFKTRRMDDLQWADLADGGAQVTATRFLTSGHFWVSNPVFGPDGVVFSAGTKFSRRLWTVDIDGGNPRALGALADSGYHPAISSSGVLAYAQPDNSYNIWRLALDDSNKLVDKGPIAASSTRFDGNGALSPDGKRVTFESDRSGFVEVWNCALDGSACLQLTDFKRFSGSPRWSPDGSQIAFDSNVDGDWDVFVVDAADGRPRKMVGGPGLDTSPSWSSDSRWVYFRSSRPGGSEVWKVPAAGGEPIQVTANGGASPRAKNGRLYFSRAGHARSQSVWRMPADGGPEELVLEHVRANQWAITDDGIFFADDGGPEIRFKDFKTGMVSRVATLDKPLYPFMTVALDGRSVLVTQVDRQGSDLMIVENFR